MNKWMLGSLLVPVAGIVAGCANMKVVERQDAIPQLAVSAVEVEPLKRSEYRVLGPVTGKATINVTMNGIVDDEGLSVTTDPRADPVILARQLAVFRALKSLPGADLLIAPRYREEITTTRSGGNYAKAVTSNVSGKAIEILTDAGPR